LFRCFPDSFDFTSFNFHVPICGLSAKPIAVTTKAREIVNAIVFALIFASEEIRVAGLEVTDSLEGFLGCD
jgi:hypothetical protein